MLKVLLIGGTGIISSDCTLLAAQKPEIDLYVLNRGRNPSFLPKTIKTIQADINDSADVSHKLDGLKFDVVCDFISYNLEGLEQKLALFRERCGQYIFISSVAAYGREPNNEFRLIRECDMGSGCLDWDYGLNKVICERQLAEEFQSSGLKYTIVRPAYTYNNIRFFNPWTINHWESWTIANRLLQHKPIVLQDDGRQLCTITHTSDFAKAMVGLWGNSQALNEDFHITSDEYITWRRVAEIEAELLGVTPEFCLIPHTELCFALGYGPAQKITHTTRHACLDSSKVRSVVPEFQCTTSFRQGIQKCIEFYLSNPQFQKINPSWDNHFDKLCQRFPIES